ncbi:pyroglutamylated RFamide peptide receptor-like [Stylophora pistillata]|uniref:pyroglutamylated RFamide peptide receptor-like n=1 Tax=Stylophora pistillata TaxID=50429 RepID=UPI000C05729E|nr:pyroglutamylated RFamide peptide receptor-like [Stylophora pistillata]
MITDRTQNILSVVFSILMSFNLIPNLLVLLVLIRSKSKKNTINYLFLNLALADILVATSLIPQYVLRPVYTHPDGWAGTFICKLFTGGFTLWVGGCAATTMHVMIAIERFYATRTRTIARQLPRKKLMSVILCGWIFSILSEIPPMTVMIYDKNHSSCFENWSQLVHGKIYTVFTFVVDFSVPLVLMVVLYAKTVKTLWGPSITSGTSLAVVKSRKRITKIAIIVTVLHALCWLPDVTSYLVAYHVPGLVEYGSLIYHACVIPVGLSSCLNPIVYTLQSQRFRQELRMYICHWLPANKVSTADYTVEIGISKPWKTR